MKLVPDELLAKLISYANCNRCELTPDDARLLAGVVQAAPATNSDSFSSSLVDSPTQPEQAVAWRSKECYSPDVGSWYEYYDEFRSINDTSELQPLYARPR